MSLTSFFIKNSLFIILGIVFGESVGSSCLREYSHSVVRLKAIMKVSSFSRADTLVWSDRTFICLKLWIDK